MPAVSQRQQRYFGAIKGGAIARPKGMSAAMVDEFASTPRQGLPERAPAPHMADGHWMEKAFAQNKGGLHRATNTPEGENIPAYRVRKAERSADPHVRHMAQAAANAGRRRNYGE